MEMITDLCLKVLPNVKILSIDENTITVDLGEDVNMPNYPWAVVSEKVTSGGHVEGLCCMTLGAFAHAEGIFCEATGVCSHAEGHSTTASGESSHAEGENTTASGKCSHAEGDNTTASGESSHAEGSTTTASGKYSHAQNFSTIAQGKSQTVLGEFNITQGTSTDKTSTDYALIVGNGTSESARSNAMTVDWTGNLRSAGTSTATQFKLSALNTAPASATDTGAAGEIRVTADYIYVCVATNVWKRTALTTW